MVDEIIICMGPQRDFDGVGNQFYITPHAESLQLVEDQSLQASVYHPQTDAWLSYLIRPLRIFLKIYCPGHSTLGSVTPSITICYLGNPPGLNRVLSFLIIIWKAAQKLTRFHVRNMVSPSPGSQKCHLIHPKTTKEARDYGSICL